MLPSPAAHFPTPRLARQAQELNLEEKFLLHGDRQALRFFLPGRIHCG